MRTHLIRTLLFLSPAFAYAHPGHDGHEVTWDFASGVVHPLSSWEHLLTAICLGLLMAKIGGALKWFAPALYFLALAAAQTLAPQFSVSADASYVLVAAIIVGGFFLLRAKPSPLLAALSCVAAAILQGTGHSAATGFFHPTQFSLGLGVTEIALQYSTIMIASSWHPLPAAPVPAQ